VPKKVDHHARRTLLADALMRVAASRGLENVSLRHVADEAGVTAGMVQHYFRTKDEMMVFALAAVSARVQARLDATPGDPVRALLTQLLPLDDERTLEAHVGLAFQAYAAVKPDIAVDLRAETAGMRAAVAERVRAAQQADPGVVAIDPDAASTGLLALVEGLGMQVLGRHLTGAQALAALEAQLALVLGPA